MSVWKWFVPSPHAVPWYCQQAVKLPGWAGFWAPQAERLNLSAQLHDWSPDSWCILQESASPPLSALAPLPAIEKCFVEANLMQVVDVTQYRGVWSVTHSDLFSAFLILIHRFRDGQNGLSHIRDYFSNLIEIQPYTYKQTVSKLLQSNLPALMSRSQRSHLHSQPQFGSIWIIVWNLIFTWPDPLLCTFCMSFLSDTHGSRHKLPPKELINWIKCVQENMQNVQSSVSLGLRLGNTNADILYLRALQWYNMRLFEDLASRNYEMFPPVRKPLMMVPQRLTIWVFCVSSRRMPISFSTSRPIREVGVLGITRISCSTATMRFLEQFVGRLKL